MGIIKIKVKSHQNVQNIKINGSEIIVSLTSLPKEGKANEELVKYLHKLTKQPVSIVSGLKSKNKLVSIAGLETSKFIEQLREHQ